MEGIIHVDIKDAIKVCILLSSINAFKNTEIQRAKPACFREMYLPLLRQLRRSLFCYRRR